MQLFEWLFITSIIFALVPYTKHWILRYMSSRKLAVLIVIVFLLHLFVENARWQLAPAYLAFMVLTSNLVLMPKLPVWLRVLGVSIGVLAAFVTVLAANSFPVRDIPAPSGPYTVGSFNTFLVDPNRVERYEPSYNRGVTFRVWYPAEVAEPEEYNQATLFSEMYTGDFDLISFLFGYMAHIKTNSYIEAPISRNGPFPLIIFNHGLFSTLDQNPQLVEHLASNGYVVLSLTHPFESLKVDLPDRGIRTFSMDYPADVGFSSIEVSDGGIGDKISTIIGVAHSDLMSAVYAQIDLYTAALTDEEKQQVILDALLLEELQPLQPLLTAINLQSFFDIRSRVRNRSTEYWVEDIQLVIDEFETIDTPIEAFIGQVDLKSIGVMGHSYGGSAAGEFCKIDIRCGAGINLDGTQFGYNWSKPVIAPFLLVNSDTNLGGNDYAYYPPNDNFFDVHIPDSEHPDYIDALTVLPVLRMMGLSGEMPYQELATVVNELSLSFFNQYLKGNEDALVKHLESVPGKIIVRHP
ncbi:MAG: hypothetical protein COA96_13840 [SAR86 cluster bacterium]|uniref:Carboxylic ester hydrolase n=1 Tax=SAR86 cluster bacterium TaxID=2030880 RepID=A0A2A5ATP9_9GAMM|nr:MAG: hypothetical protein COA96_13840 [SAR86 cluster bacterium]